jgi:hypothetical protein
MSYWSETLKEIFLDPPEGAGGWTILLARKKLLKVRSTAGKHMNADRMQIESI